MEVEGKQYYNRHPRVRKFIELNDLQQHTGHKGKTKHVKDHKKDKRKNKLGLIEEIFKKNNKTIPELTSNKALISGTIRVLHIGF